MENAFTWSKLTLQERYNFGLFIVISTLSGIIMWQESEKKDLRTQLDEKDTRYIERLEEIEQKYNEQILNVQSLKRKVDEKP